MVGWRWVLSVVRPPGPEPGGSDEGAGGEGERLLGDGLASELVGHVIDSEFVVGIGESVETFLPIGVEGGSIPRSGGAMESVVFVDPRVVGEVEGVATVGGEEDGFAEHSGIAKGPDGLCCEDDGEDGEETGPSGASGLGMGCSEKHAPGEEDPEEDPEEAGGSTEAVQAEEEADRNPERPVEAGWSWRSETRCRGGGLVSTFPEEHAEEGPHGEGGGE